VLSAGVYVASLLLHCGNSYVTLISNSCSAFSNSHSASHVALLSQPLLALPGVQAAADVISGISTVPEGFTRAELAMLWLTLHKIEQFRLVYGAALLPELFSDVLQYPDLLRVERRSKSDLFGSIECNHFEVSTALVGAHTAVDC
jgi:hypothetical protein